MLEKTEEFRVHFSEFILAERHKEYTELHISRPRKTSFTDTQNIHAIRTPHGASKVRYGYAVVWASGGVTSSRGTPRHNSFQGQIYGSGWTRTLGLVSAPMVSLVLVCLPDSWRAIMFDARL